MIQLNDEMSDSMKIEWRNKRENRGRRMQWSRLDKKKD